MSGQNLETCIFSNKGVGGGGAEAIAPIAHPPPPPFQMGLL